MLVGCVCLGSGNILINFEILLNVHICSRGLCVFGQRNISVDFQLLLEVLFGCGELCVFGQWKHFNQF